MWDMVMFMLFSTLEVYAAFVLMMAIFRMNALEYIWQSFIIALLMGIQSYFLREVDLGYIATLINLLCYVLLLTTVVKVSLIWSAIVACIGFFLYGTIQAVLFTTIRGELLQIVTSVLIMALSYVLYRFGIGFALDFDKLRFKGERIIVITVIILSFILMTISLYQHQVWINILFFAVASGLFLYYAIQKEREDFL